MGLNAANPCKVEFQNFMHHNNNNNNNNTMFRSLGNSLVTRPLHCITSRTSLSPPPPPPPPQSPMLWHAVNSLMDYLFTLLQTEDVKSQIMEVIKAVILQRETARSHLNYTVIASSYFLMPFC